jgi:hypothetical protein
VPESSASRIRPPVPDRREGGTVGSSGSGPVSSAAVSYRSPFPDNEIELGSGQFGSEQWRLMYDPVGPVPPDEHHITGPEVMLYSRDGGSGRPVPRKPLAGSLGCPHLDVRSFYSTAYLFGEVAVGFDRVQVHCARGPTVDALVIDCTDHLPFNYYVAEIISRWLRITATGPDGRTADMEHPQ